MSKTDTAALRKERGAFFTPPEMSHFIVNWAVRSPDDAVLEPSCGEAAFLLPAGNLVRELANGQLPFGSLKGIELHGPSAAESSRLLRTAGLSGEVQAADFFDVEPKPTYDAVVGNPPYVRYQQFTGDARAKALRAAFKQGVKLNGLCSSWAAFVVHGSQFLRPDGRLGMVLPAELLAVSYAAPVRSFLLKRFAKVRLVLFEKLVFPGVLEEVVLLLAEGSGGADCFEVFQASGLQCLESVKADAWSGFTPRKEEKWTPALVPGAAVEVYRSLCESEGFCELLDWGETYLGAVTGNNRYFSLTAEEAQKLGLKQRELLRISPPGSRHLGGLSFGSRAWRELGEDGAACYLFYPNEKRPSEAAQRYIRRGQRKKVHKAYKCRMRSPWWRVPIVEKPDLLLTYMDQERPRLTANVADVYHLNSLYGVKLNGNKRLGKELLPLACLNSLTLLGAEMVGRAYGGGLLKLEPTEADKLPVPAASLLEEDGKELRALRPQLSKALRQRKLRRAVEMVDEVLLTRLLSVPEDAIESLREARDLLFSRRVARGKSGKNR